jgi:hypothetical protein
MNVKTLTRPQVESMSHDTAEIAKPPPAHCSFCGKAQDQVNLIAGPNAVFICDECADLSVKTFSEGTLNLRTAYFTYLTVAKLLWPVSRALQWRKKST